jgi:hypothetical protein
VVRVGGALFVAEVKESVFLVEIGLVKENEKAKIDERSRALEKALDDAANAKTKEEFIDAQKRVAANQP